MDGLVAAGVGFEGVVVTNAACYAVAAFLVALIRLRPTREGPDGQSPVSASYSASSILGEWVDGLRVVRQSPVVAVVFVATALALLGDAMFSAMLAPFVAVRFSDAAAIIGMIAAGRGIGGLLGGLLTAPIARHLSPMYLMSAAAVCSGVLFVVFVTIASVPIPSVPILSVPLALAGVALVAGVFSVIWDASIQTMVQTNVEDHYLGRVFGAFNTTNYATLTLGAGAAAVAGERFGPENLIYAAAVLYTLSGIVAIILARPRSAN